MEDVLGGEGPKEFLSRVAIVIAVMWGVVAVAGIWSPILETGTDPTRVPLAAIFAPVAGAIGTAFVCVYAAGGRRSER